MPYSRPLKDLIGRRQKLKRSLAGDFGWCDFESCVTYPRGWVRTGDFRNDGIPADREAFAREHGCERVASVNRDRVA
jgi:hypothetical protein